MMRKKINISHVLAGQKLGIKEVDDGIWLVSFMRYDLGYRPGTEDLADHRQSVRHEIVTHVLGTSCYLCLGNGPRNLVAEEGFEPPTHGL